MPHTAHRESRFDRLRGRHGSGGKNQAQCRHLHRVSFLLQRTAQTFHHALHAALGRKKLPGQLQDPHDELHQRAKRRASRHPIAQAAAAAARQQPHGEKDRIVARRALAVAQGFQQQQMGMRAIRPDPKPQKRFGARRKPVNARGVNRCRSRCNHSSEYRQLALLLTVARSSSML